MIRPADLRTPEAAALERELVGLDPLVAVTAARRAHPHLDPELISALASQARLRERARDRLGAWAEGLVLTDAGLQQASRAAVARYRGSELVRRLGRADATVADLGCGLGVDALGLAHAGFDVRAIEIDPWTAEAARINTAPSRRIRVECGDALDLDLTGCAAAFCDPARRDEGGPANRLGTRTRAYADPAEWSPPWPWVRGLADRMPVVAKAAPALTSSQVPPSAELEWIACDGVVVETSVWFAPLAGARRRATAMDDSGTASISDRDPTSDRAGGVQSILIEASPAVVRAGLLSALAATLDLVAVSTSTRWLTAETAPRGPLARSWEVVRELPSDPRALRAALRDSGSVTWKTRDIGMTAEQMARRVGHRAVRDGRALTVAWVRTADEQRAFEVRAVTT